MKAFRDGRLVARSTNGLAPKSVERSNLFVGKSNWPSCGAFEGVVSDIKVWSYEVDWSVCGALLSSNGAIVPALPDQPDINGGPASPLATAESWVMSCLARPAG